MRLCAAVLPDPKRNPRFCESGAGRSMMTYMDAARMTSDNFVSGMKGTVAVLYPAYVCSVQHCVAPMKSAEESLI
jgi:hypothetical protein